MNKTEIDAVKMPIKPIQLTLPPFSSLLSLSLSRGVAEMKMLLKEAVLFTKKSQEVSFQHKVFITFKQIYLFVCFYYNLITDI